MKSVLKKSDRYVFFRGAGTFFRVENRKIFYKSFFSLWSDVGVGFLAETGPKKNRTKQNSRNGRVLRRQIQCDHWPVSLFFRSMTNFPFYRILSPQSSPERIRENRRFATAESVQNAFRAEFSPRMDSHDGNTSNGATFHLQNARFRKTASFGSITALCSTGPAPIYTVQKVEKKGPPKIFRNHQNRLYCTPGWFLGMPCKENIVNNKLKAHTLYG